MNNVKMRIPAEDIAENDFSLIREIHERVIRDFKLQDLPETKYDLRDPSTMMCYVSDEMNRICAQNIISNIRVFNVGGFDVSFVDDYDHELTRIDVNYTNTDANDFISRYIKHVHDVLKEHAEEFDNSELNLNGLIEIIAQKTPACIEFFYKARGIKIIANTLEASEY